MFGSSPSEEGGLLGLKEDEEGGKDNHNALDRPREVIFPSSHERIAHVSVGHRHALAVTEDGKVYTWGRLFDRFHGCHHRRRGGGESLSKKEDAAMTDVVASPRLVSFPNYDECDGDGGGAVVSSAMDAALTRHVLGQPPQHGGDMPSWAYGKNGDGATGAMTEDEPTPSWATAALRAHAGADLSIFVMKSGRVLSCGRASGRLGQGEDVAAAARRSSGCGGGDVDVVADPSPMFGALRLWRG